MLTVIPLLFVSAVFFKSRSAGKDAAECASDAYYASVISILMLGAIACAENLGLIG